MVLMIFIWRFPLSVSASAVRAWKDHMLSFYVHVCVWAHLSRTQGPTGVRGNGPPNIRLFSLIKNQCGQTALKGDDGHPSKLLHSDHPPQRAMHTWLPPLYLKQSLQTSLNSCSENTTPPPCPPQPWISDLISVFLLTNNGPSGSLHTAQWL